MSDMRYFIQRRTWCAKCKREVDVVTTNQSAGAMYSRHFPPGTMKFCENSLAET